MHSGWYQDWMLKSPGPLRFEWAERQERGPGTKKKIRRERQSYLSLEFIQKFESEKKRMKMIQ